MSVPGITALTVPFRKPREVWNVISASRESLFHVQNDISRARLAVNELDDLLDLGPIARGASVRLSTSVLSREANWGGA
jgi:hypothetical protein